MKKFLAALLIIAEAFTLTLAVSSETQPPIDAIVELKFTDTEDDYEYAKRCADMVTDLIPGAESEYIYDTLLCGFHVRLPKSALGTLESFGFVKNVHISGEYEPLAYNESDMANLASEMIGIDAARQAKLDGDGVIVAVIDSGFDVTHPAFDSAVTEALDLSEFDSMKLSLRPYAVRKVKDVSELTYNSKIPFMYDYAHNDTDVLSSSTHGTHVAGIIGAASTEDGGMQGIAPGTQLLLMKVFNDENNTASDFVLLTALEDAIKLGADVINLSLGNYSGSVDSVHFPGLPDVIDRAEKYGCMIICAVGNAGVSTSDSLISDKNELNYPSAGYTDFGTIASPAAAVYPIAVASADNYVSYFEHFRHAENGELYIRYTDTSVSSGIIDVPFTKYFDGKTLEYEAIPNLGEDADYEGIDVKGKLALIKRGTITFIDKVNTAAAHGAVGAIIYNNEPDEYINMELTGVTIPAISISLADGEALIAEEVKKLMFDDGFTFRDQTDSAGKMSAFSSYGPTPSLTLKPDITAVGGGVLSSINGGGYGGLSGTSMASPQISGVCALMVQAEAQRGVTDKPQRAKNIRNAIMNTAVPILQSNGTEYSPRAQGAGLVDMESLLSRELAVTYGEGRLAKAELFDGLSDEISFDVTVENLTDGVKEVRLGVTLTTDGYTEVTVDGKTSYYNTLEAIADKTSVINAEGEGNINRNAENYAPLVISLEGGESRIVTISIKLDGEYHGELAKIFENGYFAEGFVICETEDTAVSLPYMGYIGDWSDAPVFDGDLYNGDVTDFRGTKMYVNVSGQYISAGANTFAEPTDYVREYISFSPDDDNNADIIYFGTSLLRNCKSTKMTITDADGNVLRKTDFGYIVKTEGMEETMYFRFYWDGGDGVYSRYKFPDGEYYMTIEFTLDYKEDVKQVYTTPVIIDTKAPVLEDISLDGDMLTVKAFDETGVLCMSVYESIDDISANPVVSGDEGVFDISGFTGDVIYYEFIDYAYNSYVGRVYRSELEG